MSKGGSDKCGGIHRRTAHRRRSRASSLAAEPQRDRRIWRSIGLTGGLLKADRANAKWSWPCASVAAAPWRRFLRRSAGALSAIRPRIVKGTAVHADESPAWNKLHASFPMQRVNHQQGYSVDGACTNRLAVLVCSRNQLL
jgi:hypothetical protein